MSSIIIPGVSEEIAKIYLDTYNDIQIKYSFSAVVMGPDTTLFQFRNCVELFAFKKKITSEIICFLNRSDGKTAKITDADIQVLKDFESNSTKFEAFADYAETVWNAGLLVDEPKYELSDISKFHTPETKTVSETTTRQISLDWIASMDSIEFQQRLFREHAGFVLPDFVRAIPGDADHPKSMDPIKSFLGSEFPHRKLTSNDLDSNATTFGDMNRRMLRWMSEEDFIKISYK